MNEELRFKVANTSESFPKRRLIVELSNATFSKNYIVNEFDNNLAVNVKFERSQGGLGLANINICNLPEEIIEDFTKYVFCSKNPDIIKIYAGYETIGEKESYIPLIFKGNIMYAIPTSARPDRWVNIQAMEEYIGLNRDIVFQPEKELPIIDYITALFQQEGFSVDATILNEVEKIFKSQGREDDFNRRYKSIIKEPYRGKLRQFLNKEFSQLNDIQFIQDGITFTLYPSSDDMSYALPFIQDSKFIEISAEGKDGVRMIGIPSPNYYGANLRVLYTNKIKAGDYFKLKTKFFNVGKDTDARRYQIIKCSYNLSSRSLENYIDIEAIVSKSAGSNENTLDSANRKNAIDKISHQSPEKLSKDIAESVVEESQHRIPAIVKEYNPEINIAKVIPTIKCRNTTTDDKGNPTYQNYPIYEVPVRRLGAGNMVILTPIKENTTGWLCASDKNTYQYFKKDSNLTQIVEPNDMRVHNYGFGCFEPDIIRGFVLNNEDSDSLSIQSINGATRIVIDANNEEIRIFAPNKININTPKIEVSGDVVAGGISLINHVHGGVQGGSGNTGRPK